MCGGGRVCDTTRTSSMVRKGAVVPCVRRCNSSRQASFSVQQQPTSGMSKSHLRNVQATSQTSSVPAAALLLLCSTSSTLSRRICASITQCEPEQQQQHQQQQSITCPSMLMIRATTLAALMSVMSAEFLLGRRSWVSTSKPRTSRRSKLRGGRAGRATMRGR